jgi:arylsulfatase A-like enzyme
MAVVGASAHAQQKPNILVMMGDDVGWYNIGAYHQGIMSGKTPNLDKLAAEGMRFTDYYAEASCTAGRANFITGELPIRTGLTTVGQAGADVGLPDQAVTLATVLKSLGYETGQFGKNHLGDLNPESVTSRPYRLARTLRFPPGHHPWAVGKSPHVTNTTTDAVVPLGNLPTKQNA